MRKALVLITGVAAALAIGVPAALAGGHSSASASATHQVIIKDFAFKPGKLSIQKDDSVTWHFEDGATAHNVTGKNFHSATKASGTFTVRFTHTGSFSYTCTIHPWMTGTIVVRS